jgi:hypothetical protein
MRRGRRACGCLVIGAFRALEGQRAGGEVRGQGAEHVTIVMVVTNMTWNSSKALYKPVPQ